MHILQPKHRKLKEEEIKSLCNKYNLSISQLPKIKSTDASVPDNCEIGDVLRIERKIDEKVKVYYRVVA